MAHLLNFGAEFDSFDAFEQALEQYCQATQVNGKPVEFIQSTCKYIKNDMFPNDQQQRLRYVMKAGRCKFFEKTPCKAEYKLRLHRKVDGDHVLRLEKFYGDHSSHIEFVKYDAAMSPKPQTPNDSNDSKYELQSFATKIFHRAETMSKAQCASISEILGNLWNRMEKNITYKVDFSDYPSENGEFYLVFFTVLLKNQLFVGNFFHVIYLKLHTNLDLKHLVDIVRVGSSGKKSKRQKTNGCKHKENDFLFTIDLIY